jgi:hypothetical protein
MKRLIYILAAVMMAISVMAQGAPTRFLGIPVDGTKQEMIQKIQAKGFIYDRAHDCLEGEFNGSKVNVFVATNRNKVWRVMVAEQVLWNASEIRIRFNNLLSQFRRNKRYIPLNDKDFRISEDEDVAYEMTVHGKLYSAEFLQISQEFDSLWVDSIIRESMQMASESSGVNLNIDSLNVEDKESLFAQFRTYFYLMASEKNEVWFAIREIYGKYQISIYYDNAYNKADGEDL